MDPEQRQLILRLVKAPGHPPPISKQEFLEQYGAPDGVALGLELLEEAVKQREGEDVEFALVVCCSFGYRSDHLPWLISLAFADWHHIHEGMVDAFATLKSPAAVEALLHLGQWVPEYVAWDEFRALAKNAAYALRAIDGRAAEVALEALTASDHEVLARLATELLEERRRAAVS